MVLLAAVALGALAAAILLGNQPQKSVASKQASAVTTTSGVAQSAVPATTIYKDASKGVVTIATQGGNGSGRGGATGSGIVLDRNGNILTNNHVVAGAAQLQVTFSDGSTASASVVSTNPAQDLATIRVSVAASSLHPL